MIKKTLIASLIFCSFLVASVGIVVAANKTMNDASGDVLDFLTGETVTNSPNIPVSNIDITKITYSKQNNEITLTLEVSGELVNRGDLSDLEADDNVDVVAYILNLYTSDDSYTIYYVNNKCQITYESTSETQNISDFSVSDSVLTISFDLLNESETYNTMEAVSYYIKIPDLTGDEDPSTLPETDYQQLIDMVPDVVLDVTIDATPSEGTVDEDIDFSGDTDSDESPYTWAWEFGDGETSAVQNPTHRYAEAGSYEVTLYVTDADGNQGVDYFTVDISDSEPSDGGNQDGGTESSNSGLILFVVIIAIITIAGIAVVVYIIRR